MHYQEKGERCSVGLIMVLVLSQTISNNLDTWPASCIDYTYFISMLYMLEVNVKFLFLPLNASLVILIFHSTNIFQTEFVIKFCLFCFPKDGEARSFEDMLEAKNLMTSSQWLSIFIDLVEAVQYVHNIGLLHTDIKRDNLLIERRGGRYAGVLIDFSNSVPTNYTGKYKLNETEKIRWRERHHSMAPEVIEGRPWTVAIDVYSLGKQMQRVARKTTGLTDLKSLAKRCLSFNPKHRPSLSIVKETLFSLKHGNYNSIGSSHDDFHRNVF